VEVITNTPEVMNLHQRVPTKYQKFLAISEEKTVDALPAHYLFNQAINLKINKKLYWDLIYILLEVELKALRHSLDEILYIEKI
jgi:hypothetical protein